MFNLKWRKRKETLITLDLWYKVNLKNKQAKNIFYSKRTLNQVSVLVLPD